MFFEFGIKDFIDILLVAFLLYYTYKLMKASGSINVFTGILVFILIWLVVSQVLEMKLLGSIFDKLVSVGVLALIVLFQDEIRRFLLTLGSHQHASALVRFFTGNKKEGMEHDEIMPVVMACMVIMRLFTTAHTMRTFSPSFTWASSPVRSLMVWDAMRADCSR